LDCTNVVTGFGLHKYGDWFWSAQMRQLILVYTNVTSDLGVYKCDGWPWSARMTWLILVYPGAMDISIRHQQA
jgi:hypothetical protein